MFPLDIPSQYTHLSTYPPNPTAEYTLSIHPLSSSQPTHSTHPLNLSSQPTLSIHPFNAPSQPTLSTHPLPPSQPTLSTQPTLPTFSHPLNPLSQPALSTLQVALVSLAMSKLAPAFWPTQSLLMTIFGTPTHCSYLTTHHYTPPTPSPLTAHTHQHPLNTPI